MDDRNQEIERVRAEIEQEMARGITFSASDWQRRYPHLEPELSVMMGKLGLSVEIPAVKPPTRHSSRNETIEADSPIGADSPTKEMFIVASPGHETTVADTNATLDAPRISPPLEKTVDAGLDAESTVGFAQPITRDKNRLVRYIGDYELVSILGQGGMGVVYKARQISLNRHVALKMIRNSEFASEDQLRRFQNEAEAVATLDHPGIVPIYEVGKHEDQRYFSMKLIEGAGLDKKLETLSKDPRFAVQVITEVAEAVYHAHQRGILHRDLKPANILLDMQGHAHVTDFGLAKRIEEDEGLTVTGAIMGTPSYMAPEQASGHSSLVTTSSDVYGLGAILYASLTGRAPFAGDSVIETLEQVRNQAPLSPTRINANLPHDLEVICLKCLEKEPKHRYSSAQSLADDLKRWLNGEPITARPVGTIERLRMWAKRKPALAGLSGALIAASILGVIGITWQWSEAVYQKNAAVAARDESMRQEQAARKAEAEARAARDEAVAARNQAEQNAQTAGMQATVALNTIQDLISQVQTGLKAPGLADFKAGLLTTALKRIDGVAGIYEKSTSKEATTLAALLELSRIYRQTGHADKAYHILQRCVEIARERVKIKEGSDPSRRNLANTLLDIALCCEEYPRDLKQSLAYSQEARAIWEDIEKKPKLDGFQMNPRLVKVQVAESYTRVAVVLHSLGQIKEARADFQKAYEIRLALVEALKDFGVVKPDPKAPGLNPSVAQELAELAIIKQNLPQFISYSSLALADTSFRLGDRKQAEIHYKQCLSQRETESSLEPKVQKVTSELAAIHYMFGEFRLRTGDLPEARKHLDKSLSIREQLLKEDHKNAEIKRATSLSFYRLGGLADAEKHEKDATTAFESSLALQEQLLQDDPDNQKRQQELMMTLPHVGQIDRAAGIAERLLASPNLDNESRIFIAQAYAQCSRHTPAAQTEKAQAFQVKAIEAIRAAVKTGFGDRVWLETDTDLEPIRKRDDFKQLISEMKPG